jgi:hypothetical protein
LAAPKETPVYSAFEDAILLLYEFCLLGKHRVNHPQELVGGSHGSSLVREAAAFLLVVEPRDGTAGEPMHGPHDQIGLMPEGRVPLLRDGEMLPAHLAGLRHARVEARVGHQGIGRFEPMDVADLREDPEAGYARAAGNRFEAPPLRDRIGDPLHLLPQGIELRVFGPYLRRLRLYLRDVGR